MTTRIHNGHVLGVAAFLFMPLGIFAPLGIAPLLIAAAVAALAVERVTKKRWPSPPLFLTCIVGLTVLWALISILWTTDPGTAGAKLPRLLGLMVAGLVIADIALGLSQMERRILARLLIAGILLGFVLTLVERVADAPIVHLLRKDWKDESLILSSYNRGATMVALLVWPATLLLYRWRRGAAVLFWIGALALLQTLLSGAAVLAILAGGVVFLLAWIAPRILPIMLAVLVSAYLLTSPLISATLADRDSVMRYENDLPRSTYHRLLVWSFAAERILERPILGWGFGSSRKLPGGNEMVDTSEQAMPLHPHNGALQLWLELGVVGAFLATLLAVTLLLAIRRAPLRIDNAASLGFFTSTFVILCISYGLWQSWWLSAIWLVGGFMVAARNDRDEEAFTAQTNARRVPAPPHSAERQP
jgi:O-antigen ligase